MKRLFDQLFLNFFSFFLIGMFFLLPFYLSKSDVRDYEAFTLLHTQGIIEDRGSWQKVTQTIRSKKNIPTIEQVNYAVQLANHHNFAMALNKAAQQPTVEILPSRHDFLEFSVITIPSIYSNHNVFIKNYVNTLSKLIETAEKNIVLDLTNNTGGSREPMILGVRSLIPDGQLFDEVDKWKNHYPLILKNTLLLGGISGSTWNGFNHLTVNPTPKSLNKKVAVVVNHKTASAAENVLIALKNNHKVKVFGQQTSGLTTLNAAKYLTTRHNNIPWLINYSIGYIQSTANGNQNPASYPNGILPDTKSDFTYLNQENKQLVQQLRSWFK